MPTRKSSRCPFVNPRAFAGAARITVLRGPAGGIKKLTNSKGQAVSLGQVAKVLGRTAKSLRNELKRATVPVPRKRHRRTAAKK